MNASLTKGSSQRNSSPCKFGGKNMDILLLLSKSLTIVVTSLLEDIYEIELEYLLEINVRQPLLYFQNVTLTIKKKDTSKFWAKFDA
jgi:hypothetical protein